MNDSKKLEKLFFEKINSEFTFTKHSENLYCVNTPFVNFLCDCIAVYIKHIGPDDIILTDNGSAIFELEYRGLDLKGKDTAIFNVLKVLTEEEGVDITSDGDLILKTDFSNFATALIRFIDCLVHISTLEYFGGF